MTLHVAVVTAGLSEPSSTRMLADQLAAATSRAVEARGSEVKLDVIELRPLAHALADTMLTGFATGELDEALRSVASADAVIAVTPVFTASYSGLFKTFFDVLDNDALEGTPVLVAATAGTARHSLVLEHALRPLFTYLRAVVVPTAVFAASEDFGSTAEGQLTARVDRAADQLAALVQPESVQRESVQPGSGRSAPGSAKRSGKVTIDNPEDTPDFEDMLAALSR